MRVPKRIKESMNAILDIESYRQNLIDEVYNWMEENGIETDTNKFADAIGARIHYGEFDNADEFISELKKYRKGEDVGYG